LTMGQGVTGIGDRATFRALRRPAGRAARGPLRVAFVPLAGGGPRIPRVAYALSRTSGNAVHRNRLRRRGRAAVREIAGGVPPGNYLVRMEPAAATLPFPALVASVGEAMATAARGGAP
jgi:RNase P protein component